MNKFFAATLIAAFCIQSYAQDSRFSLGGDISIGFAPIKGVGTEDVGDHSTTQVGNQLIEQHPVLEHTEKIIPVASIKFNLALDLRLFELQNCNIGIRAGAGFGRYGTYSDGLMQGAFGFELPAYAYCKTTSNDLNYGLLLGYKLTLSSLSYQLFMTAVEFDIDGTFLRIYGSPFASKYYTLYTDGRLEARQIFREFGVSIGYGF
jgi:hypothetical protein